MNENKPIIGITASSRNEENRMLSLKETYFDSILRAGGLPVMLPCTTDESAICALLECMDGLLLSGGCDVHPKRYGEDILPACGIIDETRDESEFLLTRYALKRGMPIFGICRGVQVLAVGLGATLFQDIESQLGLPASEHRQEPPFDDYKHAVRFKEGGLFARITGTELMLTNSMHHQAIKEAGENIRIEGITMDGIIEAISMKDNDSVLGVQFHPEYLSHYSDFAARIFTYFIEKAAEFKHS